jgi:hypothetical protein
MDKNFDNAILLAILATAIILVLLSTTIEPSNPEEQTEISAELFDDVEN